MEETIIEQRHFLVDFLMSRWNVEDMHWCYGSNFPHSFLRILPVSKEGYHENSEHLTEPTKLLRSFEGYDWLGCFKLSIGF